MKRFSSSLRSRSGKVAAFTAALVVMATSALAGPPTMPAIELPVDAESVAAAIALVGGTILLLVFGVAIGFALAKKLKSRIMRSV